MGSARAATESSGSGRAPRRTIARGRLQAAAVACVAAVSIAGCGGSHRQSDQQQVADVLRSYLQAQVNGDGQSACALLTAQGQQQLVALVMKAGKGLVTARPSCQDAVGLVSAFAGRQLLNGLKNAQIENVQVRDGDASATVIVQKQPAQTVTLVKSGAGWLIAAVPGLSG
jgi:hypothetical protein